MPELPDLAILAEAFQAALVGRPLLRLEVLQPLVVRGTPAEALALGGQRLCAVCRRGKFLDLQFDRDRIVVNAMLSGRFGLAAPGTRPLPQTAVVLHLGPRGAGNGAAERAQGADWTHDAAWLPDPSAPVELRYRDPTRMGKVYLLPHGVPRAVPGWQDQGPDADDPALDLPEWQARIRRFRGELKNVLRAQLFVAGIGNAYSDEILWAAGLAPFRRRPELATDESSELFEATRTVLPWAIDELRRRVPPRFEVEVRDFLRVHRRGGQPCPRCGTTLSEVAPGGFVTTFCRSCQR